VDAVRVKVPKKMGYTADLDPDAYGISETMVQIITDPDPGWPKTTSYGYESGTLDPYMFFLIFLAVLWNCNYFYCSGSSSYF
jgi:hypothetical protein